MKLLVLNAVCSVAGSRLSKALLVAMIAFAGLASGAYAAPASHSVGDRMYVNAGGLNVRTGPGLGYSVKTQLSRGQSVKIIGGPAFASGYTWYKITGYNSSGSSGWSAGKFLSHSSTGGSGGGSTSGSHSYAHRTCSSVGPWIKVTATAYNEDEWGSDGTMFTGRKTHQGAVATDPNYLPMGTRMQISGYGNETFVAEDTGSAVKRWWVDIWVPTVAQANAFGLQTRYIRVCR